MTDQESKQYMFVLIWLAVVMFSVGVILSSTIVHNPDRVLEIACKSACERRHSEMLSVQGNVCLCKNLTAMSGDYGQLFLKGR